MRVRGYTSTAFGCPYEGKTSVDRLVEVSGRLLDLGCYEVSVGDTIGVANPVQVVEVIAALEKKRSLDKFSMHFHDTRGTALVNILAAFNVASLYMMLRPQAWAAVPMPRVPPVTCPPKTWFIYAIVWGSKLAWTWISWSAPPPLCWQKSDVPPHQNF